MGQKVNPHGLRVGVIKDWDSRWFESDEKFGDTLVSDYKVRKALKERLFLAGVPKIEIERDSQRVRIFIHCAKPGMVIGRGGTEINKLSSFVEGLVGKPVKIEIVEVRSPDLNAQLVAENIAGQLERRISFRRAMKQAIGRTMRLGAKGIKVAVGGRLGGAEIARSEHYHEGSIPLQTLRADIEYGFWEAMTTYGKIGVKVWIYKGEVLSDSKRKGRAPLLAAEKPGRRDRRDSRDNRGGFRDRDDRGGYSGRSGGNRPGGGYSGNRPGGSSSSYGGNRPGGSYGGNRTGSGGSGGYTGGNRAGGNYAGSNRPSSYAGSNRAPVAPDANKSGGDNKDKEAQGNVDAEKS